MSNKDSQNIFSSYYTNVLLENTVNELTGQDRAKLSRLEHLRDLIKTQKDITEEDRKKALFQINGAIAKLKGESPTTTDSESEDPKPSTSKTPYTDDEGNISVGPNTPAGNVTYGGPMPTDVMDAEFNELEQEDPDAVDTTVTRNLSYDLDGTEIPVDPNNPTIAAGDEEFGIGRFKKPKTGRVVVKPVDQSQGSFSRPRRVR
jgi:hypothetical protein